MKCHVSAGIAVMALSTLMAFPALAGVESKKEYRAQATEIRQELKDTAASIKAVNAEIKEIRTHYQEIKKAYQESQQLPEGITEAEWAEIRELRKEITALNQQNKQANASEKEAEAQAASAAISEEEAEAQEDLLEAQEALQDEAVQADGSAEEAAETDAKNKGLVKSLVNAGDYDGALAVLNERRETRAARLERRREVLKRWQEIRERLQY